MVKVTVEKKVIVGITADRHASAVVVIIDFFKDGIACKAGAESRPCIVTGFLVEPGDLDSFPVEIVSFKIDQVLLCGRIVCGRTGEVWFFAGVSPDVDPASCGVTILSMQVLRGIKLVSTSAEIDGITRRND